MVDVGAELSYPVKRLLCPPSAKYRRHEETYDEWASSSSADAYQVAAGVDRGSGVNGGNHGREVLLSSANQHVARGRDWIHPTGQGNYEFQM